MRRIVRRQTMAAGWGVLLGFLTTWCFIRRIDDSTVVMSKEDLTNGSEVKFDETIEMVVRSDNGRLKSRIHCIILSNNATKAESVRVTWGRRCDSLVFVTSRPQSDLETVQLPYSIPDTRNHLWDKTKIGFSDAYSNFFGADWFLKGDDDTYVVVDNLRKLLRDYDTTDSLYFGCRMTQKIQTALHQERNATWLSGGAGYVLSRGALQRFVETSLNRYNCSDGLTVQEDVNMAQCLLEDGVRLIDTRDFLGRERFFPIVPFLRGRLIPGHSSPLWWYWDIMHYKSPEGVECCAESFISFHYVDPQTMIIIEVFLYYLSPYQH